MTNAMLVLLSGKVIYEEKERSENLSEPNDFVLIPAHVTHKLTGLEDAQLLLIQSRKSCVPASSGSYHISSVPANSVAHWRGGQEVQADGAEP